MRILSRVAVMLVIVLFHGACSPGDPRSAPVPTGTSAPTPPVPEVAGASPTEGEVATKSPRGSPVPTASPSPAPNETGTASPHAAWVAIEDEGVLKLVDLDDGRILQEHVVGGGPHNITVAADGTVAAALYASDAVAVVTPDGEVRQVVLGGRPHDVKPTADRFVVANEAGRRIEILSTAGEVLGRIELDFEPHDLSLTADGSTAWVTLNDTDRLAEVDLTARRVRRYVPTGRSPHDIRIGADRRIWVTDWSGPLHVFDPQGDHLETLQLGEEAHHLAFSPDGGRLWLVDHATRRAYIIDTAAVEVADQVEVPGAPHHVAITDDGALAAIADHTNGTVVVYDTDDLTRVMQIPVGAGPHGVWEQPATNSQRAS